ncbi:Ribose import permease protein RbsC [Baekduia alba]|uniref:ABC transporter permease n=1 Tax=Baekduia alba TaxID=2997333 RepID=UPI002342072E|nr:ABC transporter permease [Baekduia alba]WCB92100.1 Ribose import permease protein RbsC [Baekduia alba]
MTALVTSIARMQRRWPVLQLLALVLLFVYGSATLDGFAGTQSIRPMLVLAALLGLAAAGQTLVIIVGGLDFSVAGFIALGAIMVSELCGTYHWAFPFALALIVAIAATLGGAAGWICYRYRIASLIVTLAMGSIAAGGVVAWTHGTVTGAPPAFLSDIVGPNATTLGLSVSPIVAIWVLFAGAMAVLLHRTRAGRWTYATGASSRAASLALVPTGGVWAAVFAASATMSALVGILLAGFSGATQTLGDPYLFEGLTAVILGGTAFMGARGDYTHTVVGALMLTELTTILVGRGYDPADQQIIFGVLILLAVAGYGRSDRLRDRV